MTSFGPSIVATLTPLGWRYDPAPLVFLPLELPAPADAAPADAAAPADEQQVLALVNKVRAGHGLPALRLAPALRAGAQAHSDAMAAANHLHHGSVGGRVRAENVAMGYQSAEEVVAGWLESPGHRANLLGDHRSMAIGRSGDWWTQRFGR